MLLFPVKNYPFEILTRATPGRSLVNFIRSLVGFTHETEKDKTENVFLGMTKLGKTKLGIRFAENLFYEIPTFMAKTRISKYEKFKN